MATAQQPRCRIYAPVGAHRDLLGLSRPAGFWKTVRTARHSSTRSSMSQVPPSKRMVGPILLKLRHYRLRETRASIAEAGGSIWLRTRTNSKGWDLHDTGTILLTIEAARLAASRQTHSWHVEPIMARRPSTALEVRGRSSIRQIMRIEVGTRDGGLPRKKDVETALGRGAQTGLDTASAGMRAEVLRRAS